MPSARKARTAQIISIRVSQQMLADQMRTGRKHTVRVPRAVKVDMWTHALLEVGPHAAPPCRLHQAQGAAMRFSKSDHQRLLAAHEILHRFQRRYVVELTVRCAVATCNGILN